MANTTQRTDLKPRVNGWWITVLTLAFYGIFLFLRPWFNAQFGIDPGPDASIVTRLILGYPWMWGPPMVLALALFGIKQAPRALGFSPFVFHAVAFAFIATLPVLLYYGMTGAYGMTAPLWEVAAKKALMPAIFEEILFRGLVFGFLFRFAKWGFLPAALASAALFGLAHISQGNSALQAFAVFGFTSFGALWFSWLYVEWRYNLWVPIAVHFFMNLYWSVFNISGTAVGDIPANILRMTAIVLTILITIYVANRRGGRLIKGKSWWKRNAA